MTLDRRVLPKPTLIISGQNINFATQLAPESFRETSFRFCPQPSTYCHCAWTCGNRLHLIFSIQVLAKRYDLENAETPAIAL